MHLYCLAIRKHIENMALGNVAVIINSIIIMITDISIINIIRITCNTIMYIINIIISISISIIIISLL